MRAVVFIHRGTVVGEVRKLSGTTEPIVIAKMHRHHVEAPSAGPREFRSGERVK